MTDRAAPDTHLEKLMNELIAAARFLEAPGYPFAATARQTRLREARQFLREYVSERTLTEDEWRYLRQRLTPRQPHDCPYCSFDPTSMSDFCDEHRPVSQRVRDDLSLKLERSRRVSTSERPQ